MSSSLTQRRLATASLPAFELPPPSNLQFHSQYSQPRIPPFNTIGSAQPHPGANGNLLTPPSNSSSEGATNSTNLSQNLTSGPQVLPYAPTPFWPGTSQSHSSLNTGLTPQSWSSTPGFMSRPTMFSSLARPDPNSSSVTGGSVLPPPPYEVTGVSSYSTVSSAAQGNSTHQQQRNLSNQSRSLTHPSPVSPHGSTTKPPMNSTLYTSISASATPQPPYGFSPAIPATTSQSPHTHGASVSTLSPSLQQGPLQRMSAGPSQSPFLRDPYPSYSLPAMPGPVLTNIGNANGPMGIVGSMQTQMLPIHINSGYAANPSLAYAQARAHSPQQAQNAERPFKCDECPQSFNRNHDLKRHKRIHLAVKPFPCQHCDKSFSRKDALKVRCIAVTDTRRLADYCDRDISLSKAVASRLRPKVRRTSSPNLGATITIQLRPVL